MCHYVERVIYLLKNEVSKKRKVQWSNCTLIGSVVVTQMCTIDKLSVESYLLRGFKKKKYLSYT